MRNAALLGVLLASCAAAGGSPQVTSNAPEAPASEAPSAPAAKSAAQAPVGGVHRIAIAQYALRGDASAEQVVRRALEVVERAAQRGAELVMFPELFVLDAWPTSSTESEADITRRIAREVTPEAHRALEAAARRHRVAILAGSAPELRGGELYNTARLFLADGSSVKQDKLRLTPWGRQIGMRGGDELTVFDAPWGRTVILICYDVEFPSITAALVERSAEVILVPSMTESEAGADRVRWTAAARAVEHHAYVLVAPTAGAPTDDWRHFGRAVALTPRAPGFPGVLAEAETSEATLLLADLDLGRLRQSRNDAGFFPARDERERPGVGAPRGPKGR